MRMPLISRVAVATLLAAVTGAVGHAGVAMANTPWWHVNTISAPGGVSAGEGMLVLEVSNLGDAAVDGFTDPVRISDKLPAGVKPTRVYGEGGGSFNVGIDGVREVIHCSIAAPNEVACSYAGPLLAYERFMIGIEVSVEAGAGTGESEVSVSGGGAPPLVWRRALKLTEAVPGFGAENYELTPEGEGGAPDTRAGAHPFQLTGTFALNTQAVAVFRVYYKQVLPEVRPVVLAKDLEFELPQGLVGNPSAVPKCKLSVFLKQSTTTRCPAGAVVGVATAITTTISLSTHVPYAEDVPLYNIEPAVGEPARFGFTTQVGPVVLDTSVRTGGNYSVIVSVSDIPEFAGVIGSQVTFWGVPALAQHDTSRGACLDEYEGTVHKAERLEFACPVEEKPQPFLIMPMSCSHAPTTRVEGDPWTEVNRFRSLTEYTFADGEGAPLRESGCNTLSFEPSIRVAPDGQRASTPSGLAVDVNVDQEAGLNPDGRAQSSVKDTTVALPTGVALDPSGADGLQSCSLGQIALESAGEQSCPEEAKIAALEIKTPLLPDPLKGAAYLAAQNANPFGSLIAVYLEAYDPVSGVRVKIAGEVKPDPVTGQLVSTFRETPQLPFEDLVLRFFGGSRAPLGTPALCGSYTTNATFAPWSDSSPVRASAEFLITSGPNGSPCADPLPFSPSLNAGSLNIQAGAYSPFTMTMSREDGQQDLKGIELNMPPGLLGSLSGVKLCGEPEADSGTCGPESLIGNTTVSVGLGGSPFTVNGGRVYITGPYRGAPYGLSIVNPAKAGPFDLENTPVSHPACDCVVVRAKIEVDPTTAALRITSDTSGPYQIPQTIEGIPLQIRHVNVTIDRSHFTFNPTNCKPQRITGLLTSSERTTSVLTVPFQVTNCATLKFKPKFTVSAPGKTSRRNGAGLDVKLSYPKAPFGSLANIRYVRVKLPRRLPSRLETLKKACLDTVFNQNPAFCPPASRVGNATTTTPTIPVPLAGPAYFVSHGGAKFPELIIVLSGYGTTVYLHGETFIKGGITSSTFSAIPDVPVGSFELKLPEGPHSALAANGNLCTTTLRMPTTFIAQNGMEVRQLTHINTTGCSRKRHRQHRHKRK